MTADIRIGDVWKSAKGGRLVTVVPASEYRGYGRPDARDVAFRGTAGVVMLAIAANFMRGRTLWERAGLRVGDVRAGEQASTIKVRSLAGDLAVCEDATCEVTLPLAHLATLPLVSRKD